MYIYIYLHIYTPHISMSAVVVVVAFAKHAHIIAWQLNTDKVNYFRWAMDGSNQKQSSHLGISVTVCFQTIWQFTF